MESIYTLLQRNDEEEIEKFEYYAADLYFKQRKHLKAFNDQFFYCSDFDKIIHHLYNKCPADLLPTYEKALGYINEGDQKGFDLFRNLYAQGYSAADFVHILKPIPHQNDEKIQKVCQDILHHSHDVESVKYALMLLSLTQLPESMRDEIRLFMNTHVFAYFALLGFRTFEHANQEIMQFIKNDDSIYQEKSSYAIRAFEVKTEEEKAWLMFECPYLSQCEYDIFVKSGAYALLQDRTPLTEKQFHHITGMLYTGGDFEASTFTHILSDDVLGFLFDEATRLPLTSNDLKYLVEVKESLESHHPGHLEEKMHTFFTSAKVMEVIEEALMHGKGYGVARRLHIPYEQKMADVVSSDWDEYFYKGKKFYWNHPEALDYIIPMVRKEVMENGDFGPFYIISNGLSYRPGLAEDVVQKALECEDQFIADRAKLVLHCWEKAKEGTLTRSRIGYD